MRYGNVVRSASAAISLMLICVANTQQSWRWTQECSNNEWQSICSNDLCSNNIPRYRNNWGQARCNAIPDFPRPGDTCLFPSSANALLDSYADVKSIQVQSSAVFSWRSGLLTLRDPSDNSHGTLRNSGVLRMIGSPNTRRFLSGTITNNGTLIHQDGVTNFDGARIQNNRLVEVHTGYWDDNIRTNIFLNTGTLIKTTDGDFVITVPMQQQGASVDVRSGTLHIASESSIAPYIHYHHDVTWNVESGATLLLEVRGTNTYTHMFVGAHSGEIKGALIQRFAQGFTAGVVRVGDSGAIFNFTNNGYQWENGTLDGGSTGLTNLGLIRMVNHRGVLSGTLINRGEIIHEDGDTVFLGGILRNQNVLELRSGQWNSQGGSWIINTHLLKKTTQDHFTINTPVEQQNATVTVQAGSLKISDGIHRDVRWSVASGAMLDLGGVFVGTHTGEIEGNLSNLGKSIAAGTEGATFAFTGTGFVWSGGTMNGGLGAGLTNTGLIWVRNGGDLRGKFINNGTLIYERGAGTTLRAAILENNNTIVLQEGRWSRLFEQYPNPIRNAGTLRKVSHDANNPTTWISGVDILNSGLIDVQSGAFQLGVFQSTTLLTQIAGETRIHRGASLLGGLILEREGMLLQGGTLSGAGRLGCSLVNTAGTIAPGIDAPDQPDLNPLGILTVEGSLRLNRDAIFEVELSGTNNSNPSSPQYDQLVIRGTRRTVELGGTLRVKAREAYRPARGDVFDIILLSAGSTWTRTGQFHTLELDRDTLPCATMVVQYLPDRVRLVAVTADVNRDGCVDDADLLFVLFTFGQTGNDLPADVDGNGVVDDSDLLSVLFSFGCGC